MAIVRTDDTHYREIAETIRTWANSENTYRPENMWHGVEQVYWNGHTVGVLEGEETGYHRGREQGYEEGYAEGEQTATAEAEAHNAEILTDCNAVLPSKGVETADTLEQVPQRIGEIQSYSDGYDVGYYEGEAVGKASTVDVFTDNGTRGRYLFSDCLTLVSMPNIDTSKMTTMTSFLNECISLNDALFLDFSSCTDIARLFYNCQNLTRLQPEWNTSKVTIFQEVFRFCSKLQEVPSMDTSAGNSFLRMFAACSSLKTINGYLNLTKATNVTDMFLNCTSLEEVRFVSNTVKLSINLSTSAVLSAATIQSIVDGLAEVETAQTLQFHSDVLAKLTDAQIDTIWAKNWSI